MFKNNSKSKKKSGFQNRLIQKTKKRNESAKGSGNIQNMWNKGGIIIKLQFIYISFLLLSLLLVDREVDYNYNSYNYSYDSCLEREIYSHTSVKFPISYKTTA